MDPLLLSALLAFIIHCTAADVADHERFEFFDDYLHHAIQRQIDQTSASRHATSRVVGVPDDVMINDQPVGSTNRLPHTPNLDVLSFFRDVPKRHWSCCLLGKLAGDKGFHCQAQFYAQRILTENRNRPHNRRMPFNGPVHDMAFGRDLMEHFTRCVSRKEQQFHTCCYAATMERQALNRWQRFLNHQASMDNDNRRAN